MKIFDKKDYMDEKTQRGDLYVMFEIEFPKKLSEQFKKDLIANFIKEWKT